uniref:Uncharacterized protein n=1 Tax=Oryza meridionalis TaxID=40149 RepID=A0A0E0BVZ1_9ORYZ
MQSPARMKLRTAHCSAARAAPTSSTTTTTLWLSITFLFHTHATYLYPLGDYPSIHVSIIIKNSP